MWTGAINNAFNSGASVARSLQGLFSMSGSQLSSALTGLLDGVRTAYASAGFSFGGQFRNTVMGAAGGGGLGGGGERTRGSGEGTPRGTSRQRAESPSITLPTNSDKDANRQCAARGMAAASSLIRSPDMLRNRR